MPLGVTCRAALCGVWLCLCASVWAAKAPPVIDASFDKEGRTFTLSAPGIIDFTSAFAATIERNDHWTELSSSDGEKGAAGIHFEDEGVELYCRLNSLVGAPGVRIQAGVRNVGTNSFHLVTVTPLSLEGILAGNTWEWLVTAFSERSPSSPPVVALGDIGEPLSIIECGGLYRGDGAGFLFGPVGAPIAYLESYVSQGNDGGVSIRSLADMSSVQVDPGQTRWGQEVLLLVEPSTAALSRWVEWVAQTHGARTSKGALSGWKFPRNEDGSTAATDLTHLIDAVRSAPERLRPDLILIEPEPDYLSRSVTTNPGPADVSANARRIATIHARPGLRLGRPASDVTPPPTWEDLVRRAREAVENGYRYLAIDGATLPYPINPDAQKTSFEARRDGFAILRAAVGDDTYLSYDGNYPDRATLGAVDANNSGQHFRRDQVRWAINDVLRSYALNNRWFAVDNDVYYMETFGVWPLARTWMSMIGLSCGAALTSDPWQHESFKAHWRSVEVMTPPAKERTLVLDLGTSRHWPRLVGHVERPWGEHAVALLWNPGAVEQSISLDFAAAGLDAKRRYAVWSFWDNRFLGVTKGAWTSPLLAPATSQHLRFTDLDRHPNQATLIGSSLHIYCGAAEIASVVSMRDYMQIELTDAGARDGDLFLYSRWPPFLKSTTGCTATSVEGAGENVWRISLQDRQSGKPQRVELGILLPTTKQAWFWLLIATVILSLLLAGWRYTVGLQLQRASALEQERTRIAGDIHDDVGANLTQISILSALAARPTTPADTAREYNREMHDVARQTVQALEEIVWSINPKSDSIKSLADFICRRAEEILEAGKVECRITLDESLPNRPVSPRRRHGLVLAFKEAVHNILKHSGAKRVHIQCAMDGPVFEVSVTDDGRGFEPTEAPETGKRKGSGLENMRRRLTDLGGEYHIESHAGGGTRVRFRLPPD